MTIEGKTTYTAKSLPGAPPRETRAEAEADEARGIELVAYLAVLPTLTEEQWESVVSQNTERAGAWRVAWVEAQEVAQAAAENRAIGAERGAAGYAARGAARLAAGDAAWDASVAWIATQAALAIVVRDFITPDQFDTLTAQMRAAGVNFDGPTNHEDGREEA